MENGSESISPQIDVFPLFAGVYVSLCVSMCTHTQQCRFFCYKTIQDSWKNSHSGKPHIKISMPHGNNTPLTTFAIWNNTTKKNTAYTWEMIVTAVCSWSLTSSIARMQKCCLILPMFVYVLQNKILLNA